MPRARDRDRTENFMTDAQIIGWGHTAFGKSDLADTEALMAAAVAEAVDHAGITPEDVDGLFVGVFNNGFSGQDFQGGLVAMGDERFARTPATRFENACATGSAALHGALDFIAAGRGRIAVVIGAEKMTATPTPEVGDILLGASYRKEEAGIEGGFAGLFGQIAGNYFQRHGDHSEELAMIAAKNHANGMANPYAHMRKDFGKAFCNTVSDKNPIVAGPLRRTECSLVSDGAAALVIADPETARDMQRAIAFRSRTHANEIMALSRRDVLEFAGARRAWSEALTSAGITLDDLSLVETHDCFTIAELLEYEAMGLAAPGQGGRVIRDGITAKDGKLPVNASGGLKAKGHPIGATGVSMHVMAAMQLMGDAVDMQIPGATLAGVFNMGGAAVANYVSILERTK
jgi:acetyl-CoA C-acetyltransferase